jgi:hypothetical protein
MDAICLRAVSFRAAETAADGESDGRTLEGYAAVFDTPTRIESWEGSFDEQIAKGAFRKTIKARTPVMQFDHGRDMRTGSVPIGAIEALSEDDEGLFVRAGLFDNPVVEPVRQAIAGGAIDGMSFRFRVTKEKWTDSEGKSVKADDVWDLLWTGDRGALLRTITEIDPLYELGPVVFPAYDTTSVGVRSLLAQLSPDEHRTLIRELAAQLRAVPDLADFTGRPAAGRGGGGEHSTEPGNGEVHPSTSARTRDRVLRMEGIINA